MNATTCPHRKLRSDLPPLPKRIAALPIDERGYPIPFFVSYIDGKPEFRLADGEKFAACVRQRLCWVCGQPLGHFKTFVLGPMCTVSRTSADPPSHTDCAVWSVQACPFLVRPNMVRREDELIRENRGNVAGVMIERNPGVSAVWVTGSYEIFRDQNGKPLFRVGPPHSVTWWAQGRRATRAEVLASMASGLPLLVNVCRSDEERAALAAEQERALTLIPK